MFEETLKLLAEPYLGSGHTGTQVAVSRFGDMVFEKAAGARADTGPLTTRTLTTWLCCAKPLVTLALLQLLERSALPTQTPVHEIIPEYADGGKQSVTLAHVLTHTVPYRRLGRRWTSKGAVDSGEDLLIDGTWDSALRAVCRAPLDAEPGSVAVYLALGNWLVLAEVMQRLDGRPYEEIVAKTVLEPLGMSRTLLKVDAGIGQLADHAHLVLIDDGGNETPHRVDSAERLSARWPGVNTRGPISDLLRLIEGAAGWRAEDLISSRWRAEIMTPRRLGLADPVFMGAPTTWSLGFCTDPVSFGLGSRLRVIGQTGIRSSMIFADLDNDMAFAFVSTAMVRGARDWARKRSIVRAVYADLGLPVE